MFNMLVDCAACISFENQRVNPHTAPPAQVAQKAQRCSFSGINLTPKCAKACAEIENQRFYENCAACGGGANGLNGVGNRLT